MSEPTTYDLNDLEPTPPDPAETVFVKPKKELSLEELVRVRDRSVGDYEARLKAKDPTALLPGLQVARRDTKGLAGPGSSFGCFEAEPLLRKIHEREGIPFEAPTGLSFPCAGTKCGEKVTKHGGYCVQCVRERAKGRRESALLEAWASVNPEGARSWCRRGDPIFKNVMRRPAAPCSLCPPSRGLSAVCTACSGTGLLPPGLAILFDRMPQALRTTEAIAIVGGGWSRAMGGLVLVGPTESGKSALLSAIAIVILDLAVAGKLDDATFKLACGIRRTTGLALSQARRKHPLGREEDPPEIAMAKKAPLLILDEVGFEDQSFDPRAITDVLKARYPDEGLAKPTLLASGRTFAGLCERYGEANIRTVYQPLGRVIDLWQGVSGRAA